MGRTAIAPIATAVPESRVRMASWTRRSGKTCTARAAPRGAAARTPQLVTEAAGLTPGTALDVGCGEGGDAMWLAERGWQVTAVDISATALQRAATLAAQAGPDVSGRITWRQADLTSKAPPARQTIW